MAGNGLSPPVGSGTSGERERHLQSHREYLVRSVAPYRRGAVRCGLALGLVLLVAGCALPRALGIAALDTVTDEVYTGAFRTIPGEPTAAVTLLGSASGVECQGVSGVDETASVQAGDIGNLLVRCDDGRLIRGQIVYGAGGAGFGSGRDSDESPYRFIFGRMSATSDEDLRAQFAVLIAGVPRDDEPLDTLFDEPLAKETVTADGGDQLAALEDDDEGLLDDIFGDDEEDDDEGLLDDVFADDEEDDAGEETALLEDDEEDGILDEAFDDEDELTDEELDEGEELAEEEERRRRRRLAATEDEEDEGLTEDDDTLLDEESDEDEDLLAENVAEDEPAPSASTSTYDLTGFESDDDISRIAE